MRLLTGRADHVLHPLYARPGIPALRANLHLHEVGRQLERARTAGNHQRHAFFLRTPHRFAGRAMALFRFRHAGRRGRTGHLARAAGRTRAGRGGQPGRAHQHAGQRDVPLVPPQRGALLLLRRPRGHGRTGPIQGRAGQHGRMERGKPESAHELAGRRLRHDVRGTAQPRLLLHQQGRRARMGPHHELRMS